MVGTSLLLKNIFVNIRQQYAVSDSTDQAIRVANGFVKEIRNATYGVNGAFPINQATDTQIIFFSTAIKNDGTISRIRYYISNNTLYKGVTDPSGIPSNYNLANEIVTTQITKTSLGANPLFYYYDGNYNGSGNALSSPVNLNVIKFIKINLMVLKQLTATSTTTFNVSAGASIRNLKTNLGN
jgi:uncharacterized protein with FMN-binding domain